MPENLHEERLGLKFRCCFCEQFAEMVEIEGELNAVRCVPCGVQVDRPGLATEMCADLLLRYRKEMGRHLLRRQLNRTGLDSVPLNKVGDEFSDQRWPFILIVEHSA